MSDDMTKPAAAAGYPYDERTGKPKKLVRTTIVGIVAIVWAAMMLCGAGIQVLNQTLLADFQKQANQRLRAQIAKQQAAAQARRDKQIAALEADLASAKAAGDTAGATQVQSEIVALKAQPVPGVGGPLAGSLKVQELMESPRMKTITWVQTVAGLLMAGLLLAAGIGLLLRRRWGRLLGVGSGGLMLASSLIGMLVMWWALSEATGGMTMGSNPALAGIYVSMCAGAGCGILIPGTLLAILMTRAVREEFHAWAFHLGS